MSAQSYTRVDSPTYERVGSFLYDPAMLTPTRAVLKVSTAGKTLATFRIVDPLAEEHVVEVAIPMRWPGEIVAVSLLIDPERLPRQQAILDVEAKTMGSAVHVYCVDLYPERSAVDRLADVAREGD